MDGRGTSPTPCLTPRGRAGRPQRRGARQGSQRFSFLTGWSFLGWLELCPGGLATPAGQGHCTWGQLARPGTGSQTEQQQHAEVGREKTQREPLLGK